MATYNTLTGLLSAIANAIRSKTGETGQINAQDFPNKIESIQSGSELKTVEVSQSIQLTNLESAIKGFKFPTLTKVHGIIQITRGNGTQELSYVDNNYIYNIIGNNVSIKIENLANDISNVTWTVKVIGE